MPSWKEVLEETRVLGCAHDVVRRKYLKDLADYTNRNAIIYYSGWLQKGDAFRGRSGLDINDGDKNGFMATVHGLDRAKGLDLILHTPGGDLAATESIIDYLRQMFGKNIRAFVPQLAMSGGTMLACSCKSIVMGKHSNLGPIDPQVGGVSAQAIKETWEEAVRDITANQGLAAVWAPVLHKYHPGLLQQCRQVIQWAEQIAENALISCMFGQDPDAQNKARAVVAQLGSHAVTKSHARHIHREAAQQMGLVIEELEADSRLQDLVLTVHHACIQTLTATTAFKIVENQNGIAFIQTMQPLVVQQVQQ